MLSKNYYNIMPKHVPVEHIERPVLGILFLYTRTPVTSMGPYKRSHHIQMSFSHGPDEF